MPSFESYVTKLESFATAALRGDIPSPAVLHAALNGDVARAFERTVDASTRKSFGAFFTSRLLAERALAHLIDGGITDGVFSDPSCGAGDLLLRCAAKLPVQRELRSTLDQWNERLCGVDIQPVLVRASSSRPSQQRRVIRDDAAGHPIWTRSSRTSRAETP